MMSSRVHFLTRPLTLPTPHLTLLTTFLALVLLPLGQAFADFDLTKPTHYNLADYPLKIDFEHSDYDHAHCGLPTGGRARRGGGDDYNDGIDWTLDGEPSDVAKGEMPWAVAILTRFPDRAEPRLCTGTLISRRHVATAAHCLANQEQIPVVFGDVRCNHTKEGKADHMSVHRFMDWSEVKYGGECLHGGDSSCDEDMIAKTAKIIRLTLFPYFKHDCSRGSDLMILTMDRDIDVPHACLSHLHDFEEKSGTMMKNKTAFPFHTFSWPVDKSKSVELAGRLQRSELTLKEHRCTHAWKSLSTDVLCFAEFKHVEQCAGQSGAGLLTTDKTGRSYLIGVLSSSSACGGEHNVEKDGREARFTDIRLFSATIDRDLGTIGPVPDGSRGTWPLDPWGFPLAPPTNVTKKP